jgi:YesN/AraC family two-component response regulator
MFLLPESPVSNQSADEIQEYNLLITDVVMPGMNGRELYEKLNSSHKNIKCLFMSGYTGDVIAEHGVIPEGVNFIQKPFFKKDLALKLREILG